MSDKAENRPIATVAVERTFFNLDSDYDYAVPPALADRVRPGVAVEVPFGSGNRLRRGIVLQVFVGINPALKDIARVCDYGTVLDESQIRLARWMKNRYFCTTYECLLQMLPRGFGKIGVAGVRMAELTVSRGEELPRLTPKQQSVADLLLDIGSATVEEIKNPLRRRRWRAEKYGKVRRAALFQKREVQKSVCGSACCPQGGGDRTVCRTDKGVQHAVRYAGW